MAGLQSGAGRRRRRRGVLVGLVVVVLIAGAAGGWWWYTAARARAERTAAESTVRQLAAAYARRDLTGVALSGQGAAEQFVTATEGLGSADVTVDPGPVTIDDAGASSDLTVTWTFPRDRAWSYEVPVTLTRTGADDPMWQVAWTPAMVHPDLRAGERLEASRVEPARGDILDADGEALVTERPVVEVYVQPSRVDDVDELTSELGELLDIDGPALAERVEQADDDALVSVITLREDHYNEVEDVLHPLPGTVFHRAELPLAPTREFARAFLGVVGEVTAEQLEEHPERYESGDDVGQSGLQQALDDRLRGTPGLVVEAVRDGDGEGADDEAEGDGEPRPLHEIDAEDGRDVSITLHRQVQRAADEALADVVRPSALVAIDVPSGDVLAVANGPGAGFDIATSGQFPPGSTFKVVTAARLLADGMAPDDAIPCPETATVDGRDFRNAEDARLGDVSFATAFAQSCNTAFVAMSRRLEPGDLEATARDAFGIGDRGDLGVGAFAGQVPTEESAVEVAAAAIGQGRVLVSPLVAADIAATVARGHWLEPRVVLEPAAEDQRTAEELPQGGVLQRFTRAVVTEGSGTALDGVPGGPVHGKTGTAEYGDENPPRTHAWFIGYQGDLAFAVLVAETQDSFGGRVAAPIAADFLTALNS